MGPSQKAGRPVSSTGGRAERVVNGVIAGNQDARGLLFSAIVRRPVVRVSSSETAAVQHDHSTSWVLERRSVKDHAKPGSITKLLQEAALGHRPALDEVYRETYQGLRQLAHRQRNRVLSPSGDLNTTALVHEVFMKFERAERISYDDREHFFAVAAKAMRQLLVDNARRAMRTRRGGGLRHVSTSELLDSGLEPGVQVAPNQLLDLHRALQELSHEERLLRTVECRIFAGMSEQEIATALRVHVRTVRRDWAKARAFLMLRLAAGEVDPK